MTLPTETSPCLEKHFKVSELNIYGNKPTPGLSSCFDISQALSEDSNAKTFQLERQKI